MTTTPDYFYSKLDVAAINVIVRGVSISVRNRRATSPDLLAVPAGLFPPQTLNGVRLLENPVTRQRIPHEIAAASATLGVDST